PGKTLLITNLKAVPAGTDGGISAVGTLGAVLGASAVALTALLTGLVSVGQAIVIVVAGFVGTLIDSLLGAVLERRGYLNNDLVNLLSTAATVGIVWLFLLNFEYVYVFL
ncbi:MAG TPA: DUF92 domain-containing protein, partial [Candidatus Sulfotelmatobacter sp.]|nr:DUF92 domain-containing protein [Candidatus Sulfotelmatobacter sp.]